MNSHPFSSILVLCEGNICRSPMAEALFRSLLPGEVKVASAGLRAMEGFPADPEARRLLAERGIDLSSHRARSFNAALALSHELILVMDDHQLVWCERFHPSVRGRVFLLGHWLAGSDKSIQDPYRQGPEAFSRVLDRIDRSVAGWLPRLTLRKRFA